MHETCNVRERPFATDGALHSLERLAPEAGHTRPETDVGRGRPLRLEAGEALDGGNHRDLAPLEQELPRERRAVQLAQRQNVLCHRNYDRRRP